MENALKALRAAYERNNIPFPSEGTPEYRVFAALSHSRVLALIDHWNNRADSADDALPDQSSFRPLFGRPNVNAESSRVHSQQYHGDNYDR